MALRMVRKYNLGSQDLADCGPTSENLQTRIVQQQTGLRRLACMQRCNTSEDLMAELENLKAMLGVEVIRAA